MTIQTNPILFIGIIFIIFALIAYIIDRFVLRGKRSKTDLAIMFLLTVTILVWIERW